MNLSGASLLPRSVAQRLEQLTGRPVREIYGMTESAGVSHTQRRGATMLGRDYRSRSLAAFARAKATKPRRVVRR